MKIDRPELFLIPHSTIKALSQEEVEASYSDMQKLGIAQLPFPKCDVALAGTDLIEVYSDFFGKDTGNPDAEARKLEKVRQENIDLANWEIRIRYNQEAVTEVLMKRTNGTYFSLFDFLHARNPETAHRVLRISYLYKKVLVVLLATKNVIKHRTVNKALRLGIGAKGPPGSKNYYKPLYTTTLTLPHPSSLTESTGAPGSPKRPHLRRGHIRNQRYGPKLAFVRRIWIEPCFINADENFISSRTAYNTSFTLPNQQESEERPHA